jgi:hypothetical protein
MLTAALVKRSGRAPRSHSLALTLDRTSYALRARFSLRQIEATQSRTTGLDGAIVSSAENDLLRTVAPDSGAVTFPLGPRGAAPRRSTCAKSLKLPEGPHPLSRLRSAVVFLIIAHAEQSPPLWQEVYADTAGIGESIFRNRLGREDAVMEGDVGVDSPGERAHSSTPNFYQLGH